MAKTPKPFDNWPGDIPRPAPEVIEGMACAAIMRKNTTGMADARRFAEEVYPDVYRIVKADIEAARKPGARP
jgi:hypothetical protein